MSIYTRLNKKTKRRAERVRSKLRQSGLPRVSVFRSLNNIYAQLIDDSKHNTLVSCSSLELKNLSGSKKEVAALVGKEMAKRILEKGIKKVVFDRGPFLYHGRVQSLADGLREGGLEL